MTEDANADLVGFTFEAEGLTWTVTGTVSWGDQNYVEIAHDQTVFSCRPAGLVRARKLEEAA